MYTSWNYCELFKRSEMTMTKGLQLLEPHSFMGSNWHNDDGGSFRFDENSRRLLQSFRFRCVVIVKFQNCVRCVSVCVPALVFSFLHHRMHIWRTRNSNRKVAFYISHKCLFNIYRFVSGHGRTIRPNFGRLARLILHTDTHTQRERVGKKVFMFIKIDKVSANDKV